MEMDGMDLDIGDLSDAPSATTTTITAAPSRFAPKQKGKPIKIPVPKPEPAEIKPTIPIPTIKKCESEPSKDHFVNGKDDHDDDDPMGLNDNHDDYVNDDEKESEDDAVIQEINVYVNAHPLADDTSLYVMQYPLRSSWRPYDLNERCEEVRVKPKQLKLEVDLRLDVDSKNYDQDVAALGLQKQTLSSFRGTSMPYSAVGIRICNQLHLNPVDAVVQLRPSKKYSNAGGHMRKHTALSQDANSKPSEQVKPVAGDLSGNLEDDEPWVPLVYEPSDSYSTDDYRQKMVAEKNNNIQSAMKQSDFVSFLCPGTSSNKKGAIGPSRRVLLSIPLEERLKKWLSEGPQVNRFVSLLHLAPTDSIEDVLKVLQKYADLVQGLWITKSSLLYDDFRANARDYILSQFTNNCVIRYEKQITLPPSAKQILVQLAVWRPDLEDWKFKEPTDLSFIKSYPNIVKEQEYAWAGRVEQLVASMNGARKTKESKVLDSFVKSLIPRKLKKNIDLGKVDQSPKNEIDKIGSSAEKTISNGTREDLINAVRDILQLHSVRSLNTIIKELKGRIKASIPELQSALSEVAVDVHGVYVLKPNPALNPLRDLIINIFQRKKANARFREQDLRRVAQDFSDSEFKQVVFAAIIPRTKFENLIEDLNNPSSQTVIASAIIRLRIRFLKKLIHTHHRPLSS